MHQVCFRGWIKMRRKWRGEEDEGEGRGEEDEEGGKVRKMKRMTRFR